MGGTINDRRVRGRITRDTGGWAFNVTPMWLRDRGISIDDDVTVELEPEGPQEFLSFGEELRNLQHYRKFGFHLPEKTL